MKCKFQHSKSDDRQESRANSTEAGSAIFFLCCSYEYAPLAETDLGKISFAMDGFGGQDLSRITDRDERIKEITTQLAYLKWRRTQVEHGIRNITQNAKRLAEQDTLMEIAANKSLEKQKWTQKVVADELKKPLELTKHFVMDFEAMEQREAEAEEKTTEHHLRSLNKLKARVLLSPTKKSSPILMARISNLESRLNMG